MIKIARVNLLKEILSIIIISLTGCVGIVFGVLYVESFNSGFFYEYSSVIIAVSVSIISVLTVMTITFLRENKKVIYKLLLLTVVIISICTLSLYLLKIFGVLSKFNTIEDFREYVSGFGGYAIFIFILIQFLQVVVLPIPSFITVGAGVLLFGAFYGALFSCVGIILGSLLAFFLGRYFGAKLAKWVIGEDELNKWLKKIKGKDKLILTFMFLFPFFPDDVLCFVAGVTTIEPIFFVVMIFATRLISVFASSYSISGNIIPYDTWWGILLWIVFFTGVILLSIFVYKKGDKIEKQLLGKVSKTKKK